MSLNKQNLSYRSVLGLQKVPFSSEPDPLFYFAFDSFEQRLKLLERLVQGVDILVLVMGDPGSGKTTLLKSYLRSSDKMWEPGQIQTYPTVAQSADTNAQKGHPAYVLLDFEEPIVIVDDAHTLAREELIFLLKEALVPGRPQIIKRLILFGQSGLYSVITDLADSFIGETTVNKIYMPTLTKEETGAYLQHRLTVAGYKGENLFNSSIINKIHQTSGGLPGSMNEIADQWLEENYSSTTKRHGASVQPTPRPRRVFGWMAAGILVLLLAIVLYYAYRSVSVPQPTNRKTAKKVFRAKIPKIPVTTAKVFRAKIPVVEQPAEPTVKIKPEPLIEEKPAPPPLTAELPKKIEPQQKTEPPKVAVLPPQKKDSSVNSELPPVKVQPQPDKKELPVNNEFSPEKVQAPPVVTSSVKEAIKKKPEKRSIRRDRWLLDQDSSNYTIQIMGVSNEESLLSFIAENHLLEHDEIAFYRTTFRGKPWFQLLYGVYTSKEDAYKAANELPAEIRKSSPWIRQMSAIQKSIRVRTKP